jgi:uncharacterized protein
MITPQIDTRPTWPLLALAGIAGGAAATALYAAVIEPRLLEMRRSRIHVRTLPADLEGLRIALLTDLHTGRLTPRSLIRRAVRKTMEAQPHLIAIAGDFVDRDARDLRRALDLVQDLWAPLGVYAVPGNHDHVHGGLDQWTAALQASGIEELTNRYVTVEHGEATICVAGVDDLEEGAPALNLPAPAARDFTLLLAHNPEQAEQSRRHDDDIDLILSGHTHGGQIRLPAIGPVHRKSQIYDQGLRRRPWTQVYTSRGLGTTFLPLRFNARSEVALLELTSQPRPAW